MYQIIKLSIFHINYLSLLGLGAHSVTCSILVPSQKIELTTSTLTTESNHQTIRNSLKFSGLKQPFYLLTHLGWVKLHGVLAGLSWGHTRDYSNLAAQLGWRLRFTHMAGFWPWVKGRPQEARSSFFIGWWQHGKSRNHKSLIIFLVVSG